MIPLTWDSLRRLHRINNHLVAAATEIDDLGPNATDWGIISRLLNERQGITLSKLRDCCDEMARIEKEQDQHAHDWEKEHLNE